MPVVRAAALLLGLLFVMPAQATAQRTFVASNGNDANVCSLAQPCRGFARAITQATAGGEVIVLDSAGYGTVAITRSVSIVAPPGVYAGISVSTGDGVTINGTGIDVVLRGLTINGIGGNNGIYITSAATVDVENCVVANMAAAGLHTITGGNWIVKDSVFRSNFYGIFADSRPAMAAANLSIDNVQFAGNTVAGVIGVAGSNLAAKLHVTLDNSVIESAATGGTTGAFGVSFTDSTAPQPNLDVSIVRTKLIANRGGIAVAAAGLATTVTLADCHIAGWEYGATILIGTTGSGTINSLQNNTFISNAIDTSFSLPVVTPL